MSIRFVIAELESQAQTISRLLSAKLDSDIHQSGKAKALMRSPTWQMRQPELADSFRRILPVTILHRRNLKGVRNFSEKRWVAATCEIVRRL
jgi:hypothetical protein